MNCPGFEALVDRLFGLLGSFANALWLPKFGSDSLANERIRYIFGCPSAQCHSHADLFETICIEEFDSGLRSFNLRPGLLIADRIKDAKAGLG
jgi:hypothetical protein